MCGSEMNEAKGCINHKVLLTNGDVIDSPRHDVGGSIDASKNRCHDCGAKPGGIHHPRCDWARVAGQEQLLSNSVVYWNPEGESDPREKQSEFIFIVTNRGDKSNATQIFSSLSVANETVDNWKDENNSNEVTIHPMAAQDGISPTLEQLIDTSKIDDIQPPEIEASHDIYLVNDKQSGGEPLGAYRSPSAATESARIWSTLDHHEEITITGHPLLDDTAKTEQIEDQSKLLAEVEDLQ
jgi:hypothetical protein